MWRMWENETHNDVWLLWRAAQSGSPRFSGQQHAKYGTAYFTTGRTYHVPSNQALSMACALYSAAKDSAIVRGRSVWELEGMDRH